MADQHHGDGHSHSVKPYVLTYLALFTGTVLTFLTATYYHGGGSFFIAMAIAVTKAMCVILFFMHLWDQKGASRLTLAIAFLFVLLLITLSVADISTRFPLALPPGSFRAIAH